VVVVAVLRKVWNCTNGSVLPNRFQTLSVDEWGRALDVPTIGSKFFCPPTPQYWGAFVSQLFTNDIELLSVTTKQLKAVTSKNWGI